MPGPISDGTYVLDNIDRESPYGRDGANLWSTPIDWVWTVPNVIIIKETLHQSSIIHTCTCVLNMSSL